MADDRQRLNGLRAIAPTGRIQGSAVVGAPIGNVDVEEKSPSASPTPIPRPGDHPGRAIEYASPSLSSKKTPRSAL